MPGYDLHFSTVSTMWKISKMGVQIEVEVMKTIEQVKDGNLYYSNGEK